MQLEFTKMHGLGNDFVIINNLDDSINLDAEKIRSMADRHTGIGFDQMVIIHKSMNPSADVMYKIFNADGSEAQQSGNGVRCLGKYLVEKNLVNNKEICVENVKGLIKINVKNNGIQVNMGRPAFEPKSIPITATEVQNSYNVEIDGMKTTFFALSMGNPHAVVLVEDVDHFDVQATGPRIQHCGFFPEGVNVGFMQMIDDQNIKLRVFERGVGETRACGSGACAATVAGIMAGKLSNTVKVNLPGGELEINWKGEDSDVWMTGPATTVYEGQMIL